MAVYEELALAFFVIAIALNNWRRIDKTRYYRQEKTTLQTEEKIPRVACCVSIIYQPCMSILPQTSQNATATKESDRDLGIGQCHSVVTNNPIGKFLALWTKDPSWAPIYRKCGQWVTANGFGGKKVPLTAQKVRKAYTQKSLSILGKRFGKDTSYFLLDVDRYGLYDPGNQGIEPLTDAMEDIGFSRFIPLQSSESGGLHLYFPLPKPMNSFALAKAVEAKLLDAGIAIAPGQCELFPNVKAFNSDFNGHRLPLQEGSFILDANLSPVSESPEEFVRQWEQCAEAQDIEAIEVAVSTYQAQKAHTGIEGLKFTGKGQSNRLMLAVAAEGAKRKELNTPSKLAKWVDVTFKALPGYEEYASRQSKRDRKWALRAAVWALKDKRFSRARNARDWNKAVSDDAVARVGDGLNVLCDELGLDGLIGMSFYKLCQSMLSVGCFSMRTLYKYRSLILNYLSVLWCREPEPAMKQDGTKAYTQVNTNEVGTPLISEGLRHIPTPKDMPDEWAVA